MKISRFKAASATLATAIAIGLAAPSAAPKSNESTIDYLLRMYNRTDHLYRQSDEIFQIRRLEINGLLGLSLRQGLDATLRAEFAQRARELNRQQLVTRKSRGEYHRRRQAFNELIQDYKKRTGNYPPHDCATAPGWHLPQGASCTGDSADASHEGSTPSPVPSGHGP